jgi:hypothetical protein
METYNFPTIVRGDTFTAQEFIMETITGNDPAVPIDLTGAQIKIQFRGKGNKLQLTLREGAGINITTPLAGTFVISQFQTDTWEAGTYNYDCQITLAGVVKTYFGGTFVLSPDRSR